MNDYVSIICPFKKVLQIIHSPKKLIILTENNSNQ